LAVPRDGDFLRFSGNVSVALRTTGASIVELAVLTYSPMLLRWAISVLLSVPSSLASALTRTLATFLLFLVRADVEETGADRRYCWGELIAEFSSGAHQRQTRFRFPWMVRTVHCSRPLACAST
jgi:glycerol-3-phosphate acyltransferase PlsY